MATREPVACYDRKADVLYISTHPGKHGIIEESLPGVLWRYTPDSGDLIGVTILDFGSYWIPRLDDLVAELQACLQIGPSEARSLLSCKKPDFEGSGPDSGFPPLSAGDISTV